MEFLETRQAIIDACLWLEETGMVIGTWGNVSVRLPDDRIMLTPSKVDYKALKPEDMVIIDMDGYKLEGDRNPTSEMHVHRLIYVKRPDVGAVVDYKALKPEDMVIIDMDGYKLEGDRNPTSEMHVHRLIYVKRPDVGAVVHCHPVYASAMCAATHGIPPIFEELSQMIGGEIPLTKEYVNAGQHLRLGEVTAEALGDKNAVLIRNHAPVCCGRDLKEALTCAQVTEKAAKCYLALKGGIEMTIIPEDMVASERHRFLYSYGNEKQ